MGHKLMLLSVRNRNNFVCKHFYVGSWNLIYSNKYFMKDPLLKTITIYSALRNFMVADVKEFKLFTFNISKLIKRKFSVNCSNVVIIHFVFNVKLLVKKFEVHIKVRALHHAIK